MNDWIVSQKSLTLESLVHNMEEARNSLEAALKRAQRLGITGMEREILRALSDVRCILFVLNQKTEGTAASNGREDLPVVHHGNPPSGWKARTSLETCDNINEYLNEAD